MFIIAFIVLGFLLGLLLLWAGCIFAFGNNDAQSGMSLVLFFGLLIIAKLAIFIGMLYVLVFLVKFFIG